MANIKERNFCEVVSWVDNARKGEIISDILIGDPKQITKVQFDKILVATTHVNICREIEDSLGNIGISKERVVKWNYEKMIEYGRVVYESLSADLIFTL